MRAIRECVCLAHIMVDRCQVGVSEAEAITHRSVIDATQGDTP
jgi:hypothetical protein